MSLIRSDAATWKNAQKTNIANKPDKEAKQQKSETTFHEIPLENWNEASPSMKAARVTLDSVNIVITTTELPYHRPLENFAFHHILS